MNDIIIKSFSTNTIKILKCISFDDVVSLADETYSDFSIFVKHDLGDLLTEKNVWTKDRLEKKLLRIFKIQKTNTYDIILSSGQYTDLSEQFIQKHFKFYIENEIEQKELNISNFPKSEKIIEEENKDRIDILTKQNEEEIKQEISSILRYLKPPKNAKDPPIIDWQVYLNKDGEEILLERLFDFVKEIRKQDKDKIHSDLILIADQEKNEDLKREVETYFKNV